MQLRLWQPTPLRVPGDSCTLLTCLTQHSEQEGEIHKMARWRDRRRESANKSWGGLKWKKSGGDERLKWREKGKTKKQRELEGG